MEFLKAFSAVLFCASMATVNGQAFGQDHDHSSESLAFHLPQWKAMHFDDAAKATQHLEAVKKLGCEVKQENHAGHIDVSYRSTEWKSMAVKDHAMADQWAAWLKASGFDVSHSHIDSAFTEGPETVEFRMVKWKQIHGSGSQQEAEMLEQLKKLGAEVVVQKHGNHSDIKFRAPTWREVHFADHGMADQWMAWLKQNGFETRHEH